MKDENKVCLYCDRYRAYYTKCFCHFERQKMGYCEEHNKIIESDRQSCEFWCRNYILRKIRKEVAIKHLNTLLEDFATVKQILLEENEENKVNPIE